jgi:hypothetical protein
LATVVATSAWTKSKSPTWPGSSLPAGFDDGGETPDDLWARDDAHAILRDTGRLMMVAPPFLGHRSSLAGEAEWRRLRTRNAAAMQGTRKRAKMLQRISNSPRVRRVCRRGQWEPVSPEFMAPAVGEDEVDGVDLGHLSSIPPVDWARRWWRSRWCARLDSGWLRSPAVMGIGVARVSVLEKNWTEKKKSGAAVRRWTFIRR